MSSVPRSASSLLIVGALLGSTSTAPVAVPPLSVTVKSNRASAGMAPLGAVYSRLLAASSAVPSTLLPPCVTAPPLCTEVTVTVAVPVAPQYRDAMSIWKQSGRAGCYLSRKTCAAALAVQRMQPCSDTPSAGRVPDL